MGPLKIGLKNLLDIRMLLNGPQELTGAAAQAAGEPYLLDVHITNVGAGSDSTWYRAFGSQI